jgi:pimeloyl-ACP methyl ester carboxylesterase
MAIITVVSSLFLLLVAVASAIVIFFVVARYSSRLWILLGSSAFVLILGAGLAASRAAPRLGIVYPGIFMAGIAAITLLITAMLAVRFVFKPATLAYAPPQPRADTQFWSLAAGSQLAYSHYPAVGDHQPFPIIYLHGGPGIPSRAANYDFYSQFTRDGFDVYLYDQVGTGLSAPLEDISQYTVTQHVADLEAIRQTLGASQLVLMGTSWGAVLAAHYMAAFPDRVSQAVFVSPGVLGNRRGVRYDHTPTASSEYKGVIVPSLRFIVAGLLARINPTVAVAFASEAEMRAIYDDFTSNPAVEYQVNCKGYRPVSGPTRSRGSNYYVNLLTMESLKKAVDPRPALRHVHAPVLIIRGACDYIPASITQRYLEALPQARMVEIAEAGHAVTSAQPEQTQIAIRAFLGGDGHSPDHL